MIITTEAYSSQAVFFILEFLRERVFLSPAGHTVLDSNADVLGKDLFQRLKDQRENARHI